MDKSRRGRSRQALHEILVDMGSVSTEAVDLAKREGKVDDHEIIESLTEQGVVSPEDVSRAVATRHGLEYADLEGVSIPPDVRALINRKYQLKHEVVPMEVHDLSVTVCISDPRKMALLKVDLEKQIQGKMLKFVLSTSERVRSAIRGYTHGIKSKDDNQLELNVETMWKPFDAKDKELSESVFGGRIRQLTRKDCTIEGTLPGGDLLRQLTFRKAVMKLNIFLDESSDPVRAIGHLTNRGQTTEEGKHRYEVEFDRLGDGDEERIKEWLADL